MRFWGLSSIEFFMAKKSSFSIYNIIKPFLQYYFDQKQMNKKIEFFDQKHGITPLEKCYFWVFKILNFFYGIFKVKQFQSRNNNFLTPKDFASKHDLRVCPFSFYGLLSVSKEIPKMLPILLRQETRTFKK